MSKNPLQELFAPKSIAIVGASDKDGKVGTVITQNVRELGYKGKIFLVNQSYQTLYEQPCYATLNEIKKPVDVAVIAVPAKFVVDVISQSAAIIKNFVIVSAGFAEIGQEGKEREIVLEKLALEHGLNILGPNCLGFIVPKLKLNASFAGGMPDEGNVAFISQSGALAVALMDIAKGREIAFSSVISVGNKMQIDESALLEYFAQDKETKVITFYLEGIKDGQKFIETARRVSKSKPIVVLKAGKSQKSQEAISSHTGALAGSDAITDVALEKAGVLRVDDLEQFFNMITLMSTLPAPSNNSVAVITNAGGAGVLSSDAFEKKGIVLADFSPEKQKMLKANLPEEGSAHNPIDVLGDAAEDRYKTMLDILEKDKNVGTILNILTPQEQTPVEKIAEVVVAAKKKSKKMIVASFIGGERVIDGIAILRRGNVPNFAFPEQAVASIDLYNRWNENRLQKNVAAVAEKINVARKKEVARIIEHAKEEKRTALYFGEAAQVMSLYGVPASTHYTFLPKQAIPAKIQYPLVLKVDSDKVLHKSDKQALIIGIKNKKELEDAIKKLRKNFPREHFIAQPLQDKQMELILGIKKDAIFGPVIVYGLGGIYTEIFKKVNFLVPPLSQAEITESLTHGALGFLFSGARGQKPYDLTSMVNIVSGLIVFAQENPEVREFDINPLFLYNDGRKTSAVDIKIIL